MKLILRLFTVVSLFLSAPLLTSCTEQQVSDPQTRQSNTMAVIYVSPAGSDDWSGSLSKVNADRTDGPFKTLARARTEVRKLTAGMDGDIIVMLDGGTYDLDSTFVLGLEDSGRNGYSVVFTNYPGTEPVISSWRQISGWQKEANVKGLPAEAAGHVWSAEIPAGPEFRTLYNGSKLLTRARGDGFKTEEHVNGFTEFREVWLIDDYRDSVTFPEGAVKQMPSLANVELYLFASVPWTMNIIPVKSVDCQNRQIGLEYLSTYPVSTLFSDRNADNAWILNSITVLDEPGEWVYDASAGRIYLWPTDDKKPGDIRAAMLTELVRIEGDIKYHLSKDLPARNIVFDGITFTGADRYTWPVNNLGWGLQHDWEMFDEPSCMFRIRGAENCAVTNCKFVQSRAGGIRLDLHSKLNKVESCTFENLGGVGVLLAGYGPGTKDVNCFNIVRGNTIHDIGQVYSHSPGIFAWQSGSNIISRNLVYNTPYTGIVVSGRIIWDRNGKAECSKTIRWDEVDKLVNVNDDIPDWHKTEIFLHGRNNLVEANEIHNVMQSLGDGNAIYISGCGANNSVKRNYVHDITGHGAQSAIRADDVQNKTLFTQNLVVDTVCPAFTNKKTNHFSNNIMINTGTAKRVRYDSFILMRQGPVTGSTMQRNIFITDDPGRHAYEYHKAYGAPAHLDQCRADFNVYHCTIDPDWQKEKLSEHQQLGIERHSVVADPGISFRDGKLIYAPDALVKDIPGFVMFNIDDVGPGGMSN